MSLSHRSRICQLSREIFSSFRLDFFLHASPSIIAASGRPLLSRFFPPFSFSHRLSNVKETFADNYAAFFAALTEKSVSLNFPTGHWRLLCAFWLALCFCIFCICSQEIGRWERPEVSTDYHRLPNSVCVHHFLLNPRIDALLLSRDERSCFYKCTLPNEALGAYTICVPVLASRVCTTFVLHILRRLISREN